MDLVRKARSGEDVEITEELAKLLKSPNQIIVASIKTIKGEFKSVPVSLEVQGVVTYDTRNIYTIPSRVSGRLERIFLKYAYQPVTKGQKIAEIYSPELITAQRELIFLLENDAENASLIEASKTKLELMGMTASQINTLIEKKLPTNTFSIFSTYSGYLINAQKSPPTAGAMPSEAGSTADGMDEMGGASSNSPSAPVAQQSDVSGSILRKEVMCRQVKRYSTLSTMKRFELSSIFPRNKLDQLGKVKSLNLISEMDLRNRPQ
jgi:hypothetical protein